MFQANIGDRSWTDLGQIFTDAIDIENKGKTEAQHRFGEAECLRQRAAWATNTNSNRNEETKDTFSSLIGTRTTISSSKSRGSKSRGSSGLFPGSTSLTISDGLSRSEPYARTRTSNQTSITTEVGPLANRTLRDVVIFASKQIFKRGFDAANSCYFDFGLDVEELTTLANLFDDVDKDKDGRLGINDIANWVSSHGGSMDSQAAAEAIKSVKPDGGFLSKLDFVRLILEREMARGENSGAGGGTVVGNEERMIVKSDDILWFTFVALDANRDGWIGVEDFRRLCRSLEYDLKEEVARSIVSMNFVDFKSVLESSKMNVRKRNSCLIS